MAIATIEAALITKISDLVGNYVRTVESLPGPWDEDTLKRVLVLTPGVFVLFAGGAPAQPGSTSADLKSMWLIYFATAHASGEVARRLGDSRQIGAYELMEIIVPRLHNYTVPNEGTLHLARVENLFSGELDKKGLAIYAATFEMPLVLSADLDMATLDAFETFTAQHDIPPHANAVEHEKWLAGDYGSSAPDASDTVTLQQ